MSANRKYAIAIVALAGASFFGKPAAAGECSTYDCTSESLVYPQPAPYTTYHFIGHGPDHDDTPMDFSDGHGGHIPGRWYWGGKAWAYVPPQNYDLYRAGRW